MEPTGISLTKVPKKTPTPQENDGKGWPSADRKEAKEVTYGGSQQVDPLMVNDPWQAKGCWNIR